MYDARRRRLNGAHSIQMYSWDARSQLWSGPAELSLPASASPSILEALRNAPSGSWFGPVKCFASGQPSARFFALIHDLSDCGLAMIYCNDSRTGPAEVLVVIPPHLRGRLRSDFPFEFSAFARFLGALTEDAVLTVHDQMAAAVAETEPGDALAFSISTGLWSSDQDSLLSRCVEKVAVSIVQWLVERDAPVTMPYASAPSPEAAEAQFAQRPRM